MTDVAVVRSAKTEHVAPLDGLRGLAILLVLWFHVWQQSWLRADVHLFGQTWNFNVFPETGFIGVDLFFFISGFCLFYPYARTLFDGRPMQTVAVFAYRRALKILPSYYLAVAGAIGLGFYHFQSRDDAVKQVWTHLLFVHNLIHETYFGIDNVMWSLGTEVQFYVAFPVVCRLVMRSPWLTLAVALAIGNLYRFTVAHDYDAPLEIDRLQGTIDLFVAGMIAAWLFRFIPARAPKLAANRPLWTAVALAGAAGFYLTLLHTFGARGMDGWGTASKTFSRPEAIAAFLPLTVGSLFAYPWLQRLVANPVLTFLSLISYNLYLWHQEIAAALHLNNTVRFVGSDPHGDPHWQLAYTMVAFALTIAVATAITVALERPLLRRRPFERAFERPNRVLPAREQASPASP